jgi:NitT/TauT family transport system permease protein
MFYRKYRKTILPALFLPLFLIVWELYIRIFHVPNYLLPGPAELANSMVKLFVSGDVMKHIRVTMEEILVGTAIGIVIGLVLGYIMAKIRFIERLIMPFVISRQPRRFLWHRCSFCGWVLESNPRRR